MPRKPMRSDTFSGTGQSATAPTLSRLGFKPDGPTTAPANKTSVKKSFVFDGESDSCFSRHLVKKRFRFANLTSNTSPGRQISSIQLTSSRPIMSSSAAA
ncbi:unnamed protein product, partial [Mycena citricolor]